MQRLLFAGVAHVSSAGTHSVVAKSGHFIQIDQPAVLTAAIQNMVNAAKH